MRLIKIPLQDLENMKSKGFYELEPYTHRNPLVRWIFWKRLETVLDFAPPAKRVLDFGSGAGVLLPSLSKNFKEVFAQDLEIDSINYIKKKYNLKNVKIIKGKGGFNKNNKCITTGKIKLPYKENFFDIVIAADVLEHFSNPAQIQGEFKRVLKKDGHLIVSGPTENLIYRISRRLIFWFWEKKEDHFSNVDELISISKKLFILEESKSLPNSLIPGFKVYKARVEK